MPELGKSFFTGDSDPPDDIGKFKVANLGAGVDSILKKNGWNCVAHCCIGLYLLPDNLKVINGQFFMRGALEERKVKMSCSKIWAEADLNMTIVIRIPTADSFIFSAGGLFSDWLPREETVHYFHKTSEDGTLCPSCPQTCAYGASGTSASVPAAT
jgi:hypothetical protein